MRRPALAVLFTAAFAVPLEAQETRAASATRTPVPRTLSVDEARPALEKGIAWLLEKQNEDGSWGTGVMDTILQYGFALETYYSWHVAGNALACMALLEVDETPERREALEKGLRWLSQARVPGRGSSWDIDYVWAGLYGYVACVRAASDPRFQTAEWHELIEATGKAYFDILARNQVPEGGWGYYDFGGAMQRPKWGTSFCTAALLPALEKGGELGWVEDPKILERARRYVARCALPNGAYEYDLNPIARISGGEHINRTKGSLGRIQVCNWALASIGVEKITPDRIREGLEKLFSQHEFLDIARMRNRPHEAYYANSGYFYFFGHYYAAEVINLLPAEERETWHAQLRPHVIKVQRADGSSTDFLPYSSMTVASTAYLVLSLDLGMPREES
ncbi:MAG: hypothetical protein O7B99_02430 [Planctomycetota bacterium]|nr:hypothetical protein [Planctomycetota bacterium]